jgi:hypothetical protein
MTPSEVRAKLLGEHFELRRIMEEARGILRSGKEPPRTDLHEAVERLAGALLRHAEILSTVQGRKHPEAVMDAAHVAEHARLVAVARAALDDADALAVDERVGEVLDELESHMDHEEEVLLGEDLLGDEDDDLDTPA